MSKAKPTPMPWELRGWSIKHPGNGLRICVVEQPDKGLRQFGGGDYEDMMAECKANAELIAEPPASPMRTLNRPRKSKPSRRGWPKLTRRLHRRLWRFS